MSDSKANDDNGDGSYGLICPYLDTDPRYARGVELGMLYSEMRRKNRHKIKAYYTTENQEQITLLCNRIGWEVVAMKPGGGWDVERQWTWFHLRRKAS